MKTSYEQFKEDMSEGADEIRSVLLICIALYFWHITLLLLSIALPIWLTAKMIHNARTTAYERELERKRKLGYDC